MDIFYEIAYIFLDFQVSPIVKVVHDHEYNDSLSAYYRYLTLYNNIYIWKLVFINV